MKNHINIRNNFISAGYYLFIKEINDLDDKKILRKIGIETRSIFLIPKNRTKSQKIYITGTDDWTHIIDCDYIMPSGLTHKFRYAQDLYLSASVSFQKYSLRYGVTPFLCLTKTNNYGSLTYLNL
ncbi:MAG: hypothetical protein ACI94Y_003860 [Maribacter sp.]|jgi:hypothetical protein